MEKKLKIMIQHIIDNMDDNSGEECKCRLCAMHEQGTFLDGLREALSLIPKRIK